MHLHGRAERVGLLDGDVARGGFAGGVGNGEGIRASGDARGFIGFEGIVAPGVLVGAFAACHGGRQARCAADAIDGAGFGYLHVEGQDVFGDVCAGGGGAAFGVGDGYAVFSGGEFGGRGRGFAVVPLVGEVAVAAGGRERCFAV